MAAGPAPCDLGSPERALCVKKQLELRMLELVHA